MPKRKKIELKNQAKVVTWCRDHGIKICGTAQSTHTNDWSALNDNQMAGVVRGLPDLIMIIPPECRNSGLGKVIHVEMKKPKADGGGVVSKEQKEWITALNESEGVSAAVCYGYEEAVTYIQQFIEKELPQPSDDELENFIHNL